MSRILRRRPSPSMVVAIIALCVALAGTATALPGRARVKKDDIARAAVRAKHIKYRAIQSKHLRSRAVTRSRIARRAVGSSEVGQDALTGANIVESSLGTVANASNATKVNGRSVEKIAFVVARGTGTTTVLSLNGLTLTAACSAASQLSVRAGTGINAAWVHSGGVSDPGGGDTPFYLADDAFDIGDSFDPLDDPATGSDALQGTLTYVRADGELVTVTFMAEEVAAGCVFAGTATG